MSARLVIEAIPCLSDNYAWLVFDPHSKDAVVVDAGEAAPVLSALQARQLRLRALLATHHHRDHVGGFAGVSQSVAAGASVSVIGSHHDVAACRIPNATQAVGDGETLSLLGTSWQAMATPGHTQGAISYQIPSASAVFTGDTLFLSGCGRLLEGSAEQQLASLMRLSALPADTQIYCGHEYTQKNLRFAAEVLPPSAALHEAMRQVDAQRARGMPSVPGALSEQLQVNPFLRAGEAPLAARMGTQGALATFAALRARRDRF